MNRTTIRRYRTSIAVAALLATAAVIPAFGSTPAAGNTERPTAAAPASSVAPSHHRPCAVVPDTVERWIAAGATLPACVLREQALARALRQEKRSRHCAVTADAAERRVARHPGNPCRV